MIRHYMDISRLGPGLLVCMALLHGELSAAEWLQRGEVEFGAGYVFDDEYRFGRYNGLTDDGAVAVLNADVQRRREDVSEADVNELRGDFEDRVPRHPLVIARTPFRNTGSDRLKLPSGWVDGSTTGDMTALDASLRKFDIETERKRFGLGAYWLPKPNWKTRIRFSRDEKDGTDVTGGAIGQGFGPGAGGVRSSILPEPVDYKTDQVDATADYVKGKGQFQLAYRYSGFSNDNRSLTWDNPFATGGGGPGPGPAVSDIGRIALAPDNHYHQAEWRALVRLADPGRGFRAGLRQSRLRQPGPAGQLAGCRRADHQRLPAAACPAAAKAAAHRQLPLL